LEAYNRFSAMSDATRRGWRRGRRRGWRGWRWTQPYYRRERPWSEDEVAQHWATLDYEPTDEPNDIDMPFRYSARQRELTPSPVYCWCGEVWIDDTCPLGHPELPPEEEGEEEREQEEDEVMYLVRLFNVDGEEEEDDDLPLTPLSVSDLDRPFTGPSISDIMRATATAEEWRDSEWEELDWSPLSLTDALNATINVESDYWDISEGEEFEDIWVQPPKTKSPVPQHSILQRSDMQTDAEKPSEEKEAVEMMEASDEKRERKESHPAPQEKIKGSKRKETTPEPRQRASDEESMPRTPERATTPRMPLIEAVPESQKVDAADEQMTPSSQARAVE
jgi:hypothetical protein